MNCDLHQRMRSQAQQAVEYARDRYGYTLDYSEDSVGLVDLMLKRKLNEGLFVGIFLSPARKRKMADLCCILGAYLGEVYRLQHGGDWEYYHLNNKVRTIGLRHRDIWLYPLTEIKHQIMGSPKLSLTDWYRQQAAPFVGNALLAPAQLSPMQGSVGQAMH